MSERLLRWERLACMACDSERFHALYTLRFKPGGGMVPDITGYACAGCGAPADLSRMQQALERRKRLAELEQMSRDLGIQIALPEQT